ncbi:MAG TPA: FAD-binding protein [Gemmatimonadaceae bacterium]|nr:FAD-binding protein [Gemmatimonadaceae bacterium]
MARRPEVRVERLTFADRAAVAGTSDVGRAPNAEVAEAPTIRPTDATAVRETVRDAIDRSRPLRVVGRGTWMDAGRPMPELQSIALDTLAGIVDYTPGDLTLTARAGTSLAEIASATAANGQWLAWTPWGGDRGSLGAAAATASAGPLSGAFGGARDIVIGLEAVTGTGDIVRGGGRVVKNVAGFDLTRLMVGAWGTLGILTEISVRLRALPEHDLSVALPVPVTVAQVAHLLTRLRAAAISPIAMELVGATLASTLGLASQPIIMIRLGGNAEVVVSQREVLAQFADVLEVKRETWDSLRTAEPPDASVVRLSGPAARFAETWATAERIAALVPGGFAHATVPRSVARVVLPNGGGLPEAAGDALAALTRDVRIYERLPRAQWPSLAPSAVVDRLSVGIRGAFDPHRLLNPGILGES